MQVEYAMKAIDNAGSCIGLIFSGGVILAGEKRTVSKLLDQGNIKEKLFKIDDHVVCAMAGVTSDASSLLERLRVHAQAYRLSYGEPMPVEQLVTTICNLKQSYTQFGGLRPFGVSFLFAGHDAHFGYQLYQSDPSGNYGSWRATAIGLNNETAKSTLRDAWSDKLGREEALDLVMKVLCKTIEAGKTSTENVEICVLSEQDASFLTRDEVQVLIDRMPKEGEA